MLAIPTFNGNTVVVKGFVMHGELSCYLSDSQAEEILALKK